MKDLHVTLPELALVAGTRGAAGFGLGLLLADCLSPEQRKAIGWSLLLVGGLSTIPLAIELFNKFESAATTGRLDWQDGERNRSASTSAPATWREPALSTSRS